MSLRSNSSRDIPYFWTRSNFAILFVEHRGASTICALFSSNGRIFQPVHRAPKSRSSKRLRARGKIPRTPENVSLSQHSIWRVLLLQDVKTPSNVRGQTVLTFCEKWREERISGARAFLCISQFLADPRFLSSSLPVHEEHACNTTCWERISDPPSLLAPVLEGRKRLVESVWRFALALTLVAALLEPATTMKLKRRHFSCRRCRSVLCACAQITLVSRITINQACR